MYKVVPHVVWTGSAQRPRSLKQSWRVVDADQLADHGIVPRSAVVAWCNEEAQASRICAFLNDPRPIEPGALKYWQEVAEIRLNKLKAAESEANELRDTFETSNRDWQRTLDYANKLLAGVRAERDKYKAMSDDAAMGIKQGTAPIKQGGNGYADAYCAEAIKAPAAWACDLDPVKAAVNSLDRRVTALETKPRYKRAPTVPGSIPAILDAIHDTLYRECTLGVSWSTRKREVFGTHEITITLGGQRHVAKL